MASMFEIGLVHDFLWSFKSEFLVPPPHRDISFAVCLIGFLARHDFDFGNMISHFFLITRSFVPMTKEEYEKQQSVIRRVLDPETGRHRYGLML